MSPTAIADLSSARSIASKSTMSIPGAQIGNSEEPHVHGMSGMSPLRAISHGDVCLPGIPIFSSYAAHRAHLLRHMAAAFRHWSRAGYVLGISGHISVRDPEHPNAFWTNPLGVHFGLLKASDMILVDLDGRVVGGNRARPPNAAGFLIHAAVHRARPDIHAVCHAHTKHGKAWSVFAKPLQMLTQDACKFHDAHSVYNSYGGVVLAEEEGARIAAALGPANKAAILRNHGLLTVGGTVDEAAWLFESMERACEGQLLVEAAEGGGRVKRVVIAEEEAAYNKRMEGDPEICYEEFQVYVQLEEAVDPSFMELGDNGI